AAFAWLVAASRFIRPSREVRADGMDEYDTDRAAVFLGVSRRRVQALITKGFLRAERFGARGWAIRHEDLIGIRDMLVTRRPGGGRTVKPLNEFGSYALCEYSNGTLVRTGHATYWFQGLSSATALQRLPEAPSSRDSEWKQLVEYASARV